MIKVGNDIVNIGYIPGMLGGSFAARPNPAQPYRLYWAFDTKQIFQDTGTAWVLVIDGSFNANGFVPYTGAAHDVDLVSTVHGLYASFIEAGHDVADGAGVYAAVFYNNNNVSGKGVVIQAPGGGTLTALEIQDNTGSLTNYIALYADGHAIFLSYIQLPELRIVNAGGFKASLKSTNLSRNTAIEAPNYSGTAALNATLYQNYRFGLLGTDVIVYAFVASNLTSPAVTGLNLLNVLTPVNVTSITVSPMSFTLTITLTGSGGIPNTYTNTFGAVTAVGQINIFQALRAFIAATGNITITMALNSGAGTFDWIPTIQYIG